MKTILALFLALATLATAQVRTEPPKEVPLRNVRVTSKEFKAAFEDAEKQANSNALQNKSEEEFQALVGARVTKENPSGSFLTQKEFIERLKKGEKFIISRKALGPETCKSCLGKNSTKCKGCAGKGKVHVYQDVTYAW